MLTISLLFFRLLDVLEVIAPFKQFHKLREFMQTKLPPGFPVKLGKLSPVSNSVTCSIDLLNLTEISHGS